MRDSSLGAARKLVFFHIPKTGGTTLHEALGANFPAERIFPGRFSGVKEEIARVGSDFDFFSGHYHLGDIASIPGPTYVFTVFRDPRERLLSLYYFWRRHSPEFIEQHGLAGPRTARRLPLLEFLREPSIEETFRNAIARSLVGAVGPIPGEESYLLRDGGAGRTLSPAEVLDVAMRNLGSLQHVGFMDKLEATYRVIAAEFGFPARQTLPRVNTRTEARSHLLPVEEEPMTPEIEAELDRLTDLDRVVFEHAQSAPA